MNDHIMNTVPKHPEATALYYHQNGYTEFKEWFSVAKTKSTTKHKHSSWETWYEEIVVDNQPTRKIVLFAKHKGPIFSRKYKISIEIGEILVKELDADNPEETYSVILDLPAGATKDDSDEYEVFFGPEILPANFISPEYHFGNKFDDNSRPHNVALKFGGNTLYGNKTVLALWSDYFDRLFFTNEEALETEEFEIDDVSVQSAEKLLDLCLNRNQEFNNIEESFVLDEVCAAIKLRMTVPLKMMKENQYFIIPGWIEGGVILGLTLSDWLDIPNLRSACQSIFSRYSEAEKQKFFVENKAELRNISINTMFSFLNETFNPDITDVSYDNVLPKRERPETYWEPLESGVNSRQDVCLLVGDERFEVHKEYLAFWSPFFDRLFFGDFIEKEMVDMEIKEVDPQEFSTLLRLIYPPGDVRIDASNVTFLLKLADRFEVKSVMFMCCSYLAKSVTETECHNQIINILEMADQYFLVDAQISCFAKMSCMNPQDLEKFRWDNRERLANLSENTRNNIILST